MPTYEERLKEVHKRRPSTVEEELWERRYETDPSLIRTVGYAGEAAREVPEEEMPLLTNIPERVTRKRPTMFIGETPEEVRGAEMAGAEKAILGRPRPEIEFDKFGEPIIKPTAPERGAAPREFAKPSKEELTLNEKWTDFRENYLIPKIGYDPRTINPVQERISAENSIMGQVDINALDVDQYTKLKKESEKRGKQAEELSKEKMRIGKDKETQAFELFKKDIAAQGGIKADARFAMSLRKEFNALQPVKDYRDVSTKYNVMQEAFKESKTTKNYVAVDQALITLFNKMTDPQSVVRESEYVRTPQDMAIMDRMRSAVIRVAKGGRLEPNTRQAIMTMADKFKKVYEGKFNETANQYQDYARSAGIESGSVVTPITEVAKQPVRNITGAVSYLKSASDREDAKNRMRELMSATGEEGTWTEEELREVERQAGY